MNRDKKLLELVREIEIAQSIDNRLSPTIQALKTYWNHCDIDAKAEQCQELWSLLFGNRPEQITIPIYLRYIEGYTFEEFRNEIEITKPTFNRWTTWLRIPHKNKPDLVDMMEKIPHPFDSYLYKKALNNNLQWKVKGTKTREYQVSQNTAKKLTRHMKRHKIIYANEHTTKNKWRSLQAIRNFAEASDWQEIEENTYTTRS